LYELPRWQIQKDMDAWSDLMRWLADRKPAASDVRQNGVAVHGAL
jgi:hypothetical protein